MKNQLRPVTIEQLALCAEKAGLLAATIEYPISHNAETVWDILHQPHRPFQGNIPFA